MLFLLSKKFNLTYLLLLLYILLLIVRKHFILDLIIILLLSPQTSQDNILIDEFNQSGFFTDYGESKEFLNWLTWGTIGLFMVVSCIK